jgi:hypothetical protein
LEAQRILAVSDERGPSDPKKTDAATTA